MNKNCCCSMVRRLVFTLTKILKSLLKILKFFGPLMNNYFIWTIFFLATASGFFFKHEFGLALRANTMSSSFASDIFIQMMLPLAALPGPIGDLCNSVSSEANSLTTNRDYFESSLIFLATFLNWCPFIPIIIPCL